MFIYKNVWQCYGSTNSLYLCISSSIKFWLYCSSDNTLKKLLQIKISSSALIITIILLHLLAQEHIFWEIAPHDPWYKYDLCLDDIGLLYRPRTHASHPTINLSKANGSINWIKLMLCLQDQVLVHSIPVSSIVFFKF